MNYLTKEKIEEIMLPEMDAIIAHWNKHGQIIEGQFKFADSVIMDHYTDIAIQIMKEHGAVIWSDSEEDTDDDHILTLGVMVPGEGEIYSFFSYIVMDADTMKENVLEYYESRRLHDDSKD